MTQESQTSRIAKYLLKGKTLTQLEALRLFGCFRLASRVRELRDRYKIETKMIVTKSKKRIAQYAIIL